jgi:sorbose reductase
MVFNVCRIVLASALAIQ